MNTICISISLWVAQGRGLEVNEATKIHCLFSMSLVLNKGKCDFKY